MVMKAKHGLPMKDVDENIQLHSSGKKSGLQASISIVCKKRRNVDQRMRVLSRQLRRADLIDMKKVSEYVELNKECRKLRIYEAELVYMRNIL